MRRPQAVAPRPGFLVLSRHMVSGDAFLSPDAGNFGSPWLNGLCFAAATLDNSTTPAGCSPIRKAAGQMMKTDSDNGLFALSARWLLPIAGPPLSAAALVIDGQRIKAVEDRQSLSRHYPGLPVRDYGEAIIAPGLINLHTHLDYTALRHFDTQAGFFPWIRGLVARAFPWTSDQWRASALTG